MKIEGKGKKMQLIILGCGTIIQKGTSANCSGYLLDHQFLFDCGPGIWKSLYQHKISVDQITHIFLTHFHVDHTSDLGPLLLNRFLHYNLKGIPLYIIGPPGLKDWFSRLKLLLGHWSDDLSIKLVEMGENPFQTNDYTIFAKLTGHTDNSTCYRVEKDENSFIYSGDTGYSENVIALATGCHLAIIEASNSDETHIEEHLTPGLAGKIAARAGVKKLVLTHMYPEALESDPLKSASSEFSGQIIIAQESMTIDF
jgi:ribonuclease BN (tRNA processing enzyme)